MLEMVRRMFSQKKLDSVSKSIRVPELMWLAITKLAKEAGETPNSYVALVLDQYLIAMVESGKLNFEELQAELAALQSANSTTSPKSAS